MEYTGRAPSIGVYFQPTPLVEMSPSRSHESKRKRDSDEDKNTEIITTNDKHSRNGHSSNAEDPNVLNSTDSGDPFKDTSCSSSQTASVPEPIVMAATLRGRGLLAHVDLTQCSLSEGNDNNVSGHVLRMERLRPTKIASHKEPTVACQNGNHDTTDPATLPTMTIQSVATFHAMWEWQHDHDPARLKDSTARSSSHRLSTARDWCHVAHVLHAPLPVHTEEQK
jgi:hypothetical protein